MLQTEMVSFKNCVISKVCLLNPVLQNLTSSFEISTLKFSV